MIVDNLPLEGEGQPDVFKTVPRVNRLPMCKGMILRQMQSFIRKDAAHGALLLFERLRKAVSENGPVIRDGNVHIRALAVQLADKRCGDIGQATRFGAQTV